MTQENYNPGTISEQEFNIIDSIVKKFSIKTVLEFGPGVSTYVFIKNQCKILSIENDIEFLEKNKKRFIDYNNIEFFLNDQANIINLKNKLDNQIFDLCFIDGPRADGEQYKLFNRIDSYIMAYLNSKYILCHDTNREKDRNSINLIFDSKFSIQELAPSSRGLTLIYHK